MFDFSTDNGSDILLKCDGLIDVAPVLNLFSSAWKHSENEKSKNLKAAKTITCYMVQPLSAGSSLDDERDPCLKPPVRR